jgi:hypothetical protein
MTCVQHAPDNESHWLVKWPWFLECLLVPVGNFTPDNEDVRRSLFGSGSVLVGLYAASIFTFINLEKRKQAIFRKA